MGTRQRKIKKTIVVALALVLAVLFLTAFIREDRVSRNIWVLGVPLAGLPQNRVEKALLEKIDEINHGPLTFVAGNRKYQASLEEITVVLDKRGLLTRVSSFMEKKPKLLPSVFFKSGPRTVIPTPLGVVSSNLDEALEKIAEKLSSPPLGTRYGFDGHDLKILPPQEGQKVSKDDVRKALNGLEGKEIRVAYQAILAPGKTDLPALELLAEFSTDYDESEKDRTQNLILAAQAVHGRVIQPGEIYSFNKDAGERTEEKGYRYAPVVVGDHLEPGLAGGICQVTTTLFNACAMAGLDFPEVHAHGIPVEYVPPGRDAAVAWGYLDLKVMNNKETAVVFGTWVENGKILVRVYGKKDGLTYELEPIVVKEYPESGKKPGLLVETYLIEKENGTAKARKLIMRSYYSPHFEHVK